MVKVEMEIELATLALKARRYKEAEEKFTSISKYESDKTIWLGIGLSKFGQILDNNIPVDEIFYCLNKAKEVDENEAEKDRLVDKVKVENLVLDFSTKVISDLYNLELSIITYSNEAKKNKVKQLFTKIGGLINGFQITIYLQLLMIMK